MVNGEMMKSESLGRRYSGREFGPEELELIREVVESCSGVSRTELANTVCELVGWRRPNGRLKGQECREFLEHLESSGFLVLPRRQKRRPFGSRTHIPVTRRGEAGRVLSGSVEAFVPVVVEPVGSQEARLLYRELVGRYHYLGHRVAYGAHLQYLLMVSRPKRVVVGCIQFSSPAWRMSSRDRWIGWDDGIRERNLQRVVNNSRFLILPWIRIKNLASTALSLAVRRLGSDWRERYGLEPLLVETLVDQERYRGVCYRAANWVVVGTTTGRGRMDRENRREGLSPKTVLVYPLVTDAVTRLREN